MNRWHREYDKLRTGLEKLGWQCVKNETCDLESWYSQGVLYANFTREGKAIHIEYGDEDCVFGEVGED